MRFVPGLVPAPFLLTCGRRMFRAAGTEYRSARRGRTCGFGYYRDLSRLPLGISGFPLTFGFGCLFFYKVSTLFFDCSFWLHQCGIPHRSCRFYCCLAAHQRTKEMDSAEPLSSILWTLTPHPGGSAAAGHICCRGFGTI